MKSHRMKGFALAAAGAALTAAWTVSALAQTPATPPAAPAAPPPAAPALNTGDTAWMLTAVALVLMMTIPGLALFYGGMVRKKNVLATAMQSFAVCCLVTVLWMVVGYSLAFTGDGSYIGGLSRFFLKGMEIDKAHSLAATIPEPLFMTFQMTFAIITPALIAGAFAERMKFSAMLWFMGLWSILVYAPVAHWVWGGGFLGGAGVLDYAGGTVVHINAGVAGLVCAYVLGKRKGYGNDNMAPHNLVLSLIGASLLWVGWFGFNAGSAVGASPNAAMAMAVTQIAAAAAGLSWMFAEWALRDKPSVLGVISGAVAGLVAITPASGFVNATGALIIGLVAGVICFWGATALKKMMGYDDSLDAFGVHGVGGIVGAILTGVFAIGAIGGPIDATDASKGMKAGLIDGNAKQVLIQLEGIVATVIWCAIITFVILKIIDVTIGLRVNQEQEVEGLDINLHGETVH